MTNQEQYEHLVEILGRARALAGLSDNDNVMRAADNIKDISNDMAFALGVKPLDLQRDSVKRYMELTHHIPNYSMNINIGEPIRIEERLLESLGEHFTYHKLREQFGWTFEEYIDKYQRGVLNV